MDYANKHRAALLKMQAKSGVEVTFVATVAGTYDPLTDTHGAPTTVLVQGLAIEIPGDPEEYVAYDLIDRNPATLIFIPNSYGDLPALHSTISWAGELRTIARLFPYQPAGLVIAAKVILG